MDIAEGIAIIILILAVLCLVYYYLQNLNNFKSASDIKNMFSSPHSTSGDDSTSTNSKIEIDGEEESENDEKMAKKELSHEANENFKLKR